MQTATEAKATYRDVFAISEFRALFAADLVSLLGDMLATVVVTYLLFERTHSPFIAALEADEWVGRPIVLRDGASSLELRAPEGAAVLGDHGMLWRAEPAFRAGERFAVARRSWSDG